MTRQANEELRHTMTQPPHPRPRRAMPPDTHRATPHRTPRAPRSFRLSAGLTALSALLPGAGLLGSNSLLARWVGVVVPVGFLGALGIIGWTAYTDFGALAAIGVDPTRLRLLSLALVLLSIGWVALIAATHVLTRPRRLSGSQRLAGAALVTALSLLVSAPMAVASRYSVDQRMLVEKVFQGGDKVTATSRPTLDVKGQDPWKGHPRLNILLLGGDNNAVRNKAYGLRTDTIMVASIDTATGATTLIQIPRNVQHTPFPEGSEMHELFPRGFRGPGDEAEWYVNGIWDAVARGDYPGVFEGQTYPGAEALKQGIEGITGLHVDYFALLNIDGIQRLIDAMGGVTVNINERLPRGGDTSGRKPNGYLEPGPNQHLGGYDAMWYARSRSSTDDYNRMARQSCLVDAIIKQANPATMLTSYEAIAAASADMVMTDIPQEVLQPLIQLSLKVKDAQVDRLVFAPGKNGYSYAHPDFEAMRQAVQDAISPKPSATPSTAPTGSAATSPATPEASATSSVPPTIVEGSQSVTDACAYHPIEE